jgi:hypothetical protein
MSEESLSGTPSPEDLRQASSLTTSLSGYVMTATLAVLGAQAVVVTFVVTNRTDLTWFLFTSMAALVAFVGSLVMGGQGIYELIKGGAKGEWGIRTRKKKFEWQSALALAGAVLLVWSAFLGQTKQPEARVLSCSHGPQPRVLACVEGGT